MILSEKTWIITTAKHDSSDIVILEVNNGRMNQLNWWYGQNSCPIVSSNHIHPWIIQQFQLESNIMMIWKVKSWQKTNMNIWRNYGIHLISKHGVNITNCTMYWCDYHGWFIWTFPKYHTHIIRCWSDTLYHRSTDGLFSLLEDQDGKWSWKVSIASSSREMRFVCNANRNEQGSEWKAITESIHWLYERVLCKWWHSIDRGR